MKTKSDEHKIGILQAVSYIVGNVIGSGIFLTPTSILRNTGSAGVSLVIWLICATITLLGSICYIELGTSIQESGCDFAYLCYVGWQPIAFAFLWTGSLLSLPATSAILMEAFGEYVLQAVAPIFCIPTAYRDWLRKLIGFMLIWLLCYVNFQSLRKRAALLQLVITVAKILALGILIVTGFYLWIFNGWDESFDGPNGWWEGTDLSLTTFIMAIYGGMWSFSGAYILNYGTEDLKNSRKTLPIASFFGISIITSVYLGINFAYFAVLSKEEILQSDAVAATFSTKALGYFSYVLPALVAIVVACSLNSHIFVASRYTFAAAKRGHLPRCIGTQNVDTESPRVAVFTQVLLGIAASFIGNVEMLINYVTFTIYLQQTFTMLALLYMKIKKIPVAPDAMKFPILLPIMLLILSGSIVIIPIVSAPVFALIGMAVWLSSFIVYLSLIRPTRIPSFLTNINVRLTVACQKITMSLVHNYERSVKVQPEINGETKRPRKEITRF